MLTKTCVMRSSALLALLLGSSNAGYSEDLRTAAAEKTGTQTLREYVQKPDPAYGWGVVKRIEGNPVTTFVVKLTSQSWLTKSDVNRTVWEHWLLIVKPEKTDFDRGLLLIGGGSNDSGTPDRASDEAVRIAEETNSVVAELRMVPNQPLVFHGDDTPRVEDNLIAYAWDHYLKTGDTTWLPRLPMVKSASRAMDCIQELLASDDGGNIEIEKFVVAGASKRGWTTWMTGVADPRVEAIIPIVIDVLNVKPSMKHHASVYGFWADAIGDYVHHDITSRWHHPRMEEIYEIVDPYYHRDQLTMPKFLVHASGDQFFCPDSSHFYFDQLKGEKYLRYVPNTDHSLRGSDAAQSVAAFYLMVLAGKPRPRFTWTFEDDGSIRLVAQDKPKEVRLWQGSNSESRDFRLKTIGAAFKSAVLEDEGNGTFVGRIDPPQEGWTAFFLELTYDTGTQLPLKLTTAVRVLPDTLPHAGIDVLKTPYESEQQASR